MTNTLETQAQAVLLDKLVELGREAWRVEQRQKAVRAQLDALYLHEVGEDDAGIKGW